MKPKLILILSLFFFSLKAQVIYNAYANVTNISGSTFTVNNINETNHTFVNGEQVIVMQMQDDVIGTNTTNVTTFGNLGAIQRAGLWEVKTISTQTRVAGVLQNISFVGALANTYTTGANSSLQIITFRRLSAAAFTTTNNITAVAWNGTVGGIVAIEVVTDLTLNHRISANAIGFRGGSLSNNDGTGCTSAIFISNSANYGGKAEGIYRNTNANFNFAQARLLNGGGGGINHNGAGGGGGNYTAGGQGGPGWNGSAAGCTPGAGGLGGISLSSQISSNRIFMGGGGGGAQQNNGLGTAGANGGGIIFLKANRLLTSTTCTASIQITANGGIAGNTTGGFNDAAGGGGAAGSIILQINTYIINSTCPVTIQANGGNGGSSPFGTTHAGGGAGSQGVIAFSSTQPTTNVTSSTNNGTPGCNDNTSPCTNLGGVATGTNNSGIFTSLPTPLPIELLNFDVINQEENVALNWATATEKNTNYFYIERSDDALNWKEINKVKAAENSNRTLYYETLDNQPINGVSYYRLKILDLDGSFSYSPIKSINRTKKEVFVVFYPNPSSGIVNLSSSYKLSDITYQIFDVTGKQLSVQITEQNENKISFDFSSLSKGLYFINVFAPDGTQFKSNRILTK